MEMKLLKSPSEKYSNQILTQIKNKKMFPPGLLKSQSITQQSNCSAEFFCSCFANKET